MKSLNDIGVECGTDKSTITHGYLDTYEKYLEPLRDKEIVLLELGVAGGASIKMWREYLPKAKVYGIDNNPDCAGEGIFIGSQTDESFLDKVLYEIGEVTMMVDDASHYAPYTILTFQHLFPKLAHGGLYFIEDTHCFYDKTYGCAPEFNEGMGMAFNFFTSLACDVDVHGRGMTGNVLYALEVKSNNYAPIPKYSKILDSIHIHPSLWLFKRK